MESQGRLILRFDDDGDGTGKLLAQASSSGFSGEGGAWFSKAELQDFAEAIAMYPIVEGDSTKIAAGFPKEDGSSDLEQEHLAIMVYPIDRTGHLGIQVRIATEIWKQTRPESQHLVRLEIMTSYEPLAKFSRDLKSLIEGRLAEAVLDADLLP